jgi:hypothetical protein
LILSSITGYGRLVQTAALAAAVLTLVSCGGSNDNPGALPSTSTASGSTPPPTSAPPPVTTSSRPSGTGPGGVPIPTPGPAAAQHSAAGAEAFAVYYTHLLDYTYATRDVKPLRDASDPSCVLCIGTADDVSKYAKPGYKWSGGRITLKSVSIAQPSVDRAVATVDISIGELIVIGPDGSRDPYSEAATPRGQLKIVESWTGTGWKPVDLLVGH